MFPNPPRRRPSPSRRREPRCSPARSRGSSGRESARTRSGARTGPQALQKRAPEAQEAGEEGSQKEGRPAEDSIISDSGKKIKEDPLDEILDELEIILLEADVAYPVVEEIKKGVRENLLGKKYDRSYTLEQVVELSVKDAVRDVLKINEFDFDQWLSEQKRPTVIMFVGINGTGKTTAIAKVANRIQKNGQTVVLAACDTFRAGAIEQLTIHSEKLGCKIVKQAHDADPRQWRTTR